MNRLFLVIGMATLLMLLSPRQIADAKKRELVCPDGNGIVAFPEINNKVNPWGFRISRAEKVAPKNPVVVGQDPEKTGVTIRVEIVSDLGEISYHVPVKHSNCEKASHYEPNSVECEGHDSGLWYWRHYETCEPVTEKVYRYIDPQSIKVWLIPTLETKEFIGWKKRESGKNPFRFLYPEDWKVIFLKPSGLESADGGDMWSEEDVENFLAEHPEYDALMADPREENVPASALSRVVDPGGSGERVLALYGGFTSWPGAPQSTTGGPCQIANRHKGRCPEPITVLDTRRDGLFLGQHPRIIKWTLTLLNAPLDLPGQWMIGVSARVLPVYYRNESVMERFDSQYLERQPPVKSGYDEAAHQFTSYILLSTLCLKDEPHGCGL